MSSSSTAFRPYVRTLRCQMWFVGQHLPAACLNTRQAAATMPPRILTLLPAVLQDLPGSVSERIMKEAAAQQDELRAEALAASGGLGEVSCRHKTV